VGGRHTAETRTRGKKEFRPGTRPWTREPRGKKNQKKGFCERGGYGERKGGMLGRGGDQTVTDTRREAKKKKQKTCLKHPISKKKKKTRGGNKEVVRGRVSAGASVHEKKGVYLQIKKITKATSN